MPFPQYPHTYPQPRGIMNKGKQGFSTELTYV